jgi:pilus assembly protein FimV
MALRISELDKFFVRLLPMFLCFILLSFMFYMHSSMAVSVIGPSGETRQVIKSYGPTSTDDTLWRIAEMARPSKQVTMYQVMLAIYMANPDSFSEKNLNSLNKNQMLIIPDLNEIKRIPKKTAYRHTMRDYRRWRAKIRQKREWLNKRKQDQKRKKIFSISTITEKELLEETYIRKDSTAFLIRKNKDGDIISRESVLLDDVDLMTKSKWIEMDGEVVKKVKTTVLSESAVKVLLTLNKEQERNDLLNERLVVVEDELELSMVENRDLLRRFTEFNNRLVKSNTELSHSYEIEKELRNEVEEMLEQLDESNKSYELLEQEKQLLQQQIDGEEEGFWVHLISNPMYLAVLFFIQFLFLLPIVGWIYRRNSSSEYAMAIANERNRVAKLGKDANAPDATLNDNMGDPFAEDGLDNKTEPTLMEEPAEELFQDEPVSQDETAATPEPQPAAEAESSDDGWGDALNEQAEAENAETDDGWGDALNEQAEAENAEADDGWGDALNEQAEAENTEAEAGDALTEQAEAENTEDGLGEALTEQAETENAEEGLGEALTEQAEAENTEDGLGEALTEQAEIENAEEGLGEALTEQAEAENAEEGLGEALTEQANLDGEENAELSPSETINEAQDAETDVTEQDVNNLLEDLDDLSGELNHSLDDLEINEVTDELSQLEEELGLTEEDEEKNHEMISRELDELVGAIEDSLDTIKHNEEIHSINQEMDSLAEDLNLVDNSIEHQAEPEYSNEPFVDSNDTAEVDSNDAVTDAAPDEVSEAAPDAVSEAAPDAVTEAEPDEVSEAAPDAVTEAEPDEVTEAAPDEVSEAEPDEVSEAEPDEVSEAAPDEVSEAAPDEVSEAAPDEVSEAAPDEVSEAEPDEVSEAEPDEVTEAAPDEVSEAAPDEVSEAAPDEVSEAEPDEVSEAEPDEVSEAAPDEVSEAAPDEVSEAAPDEVSEAAPDEVSEAAPDEVSEAAPDEVSEAAPDEVSEVAPDEVSEVAPDEVSEAALDEVSEAAPDEVSEAALDEVTDAVDPMPDANQEKIYASQSGLDDEFSHEEVVLDLPDENLEEMLSKLNLPSFDREDLISPHLFDAQEKANHKKMKSPKELADDLDVDSDYIDIGSLLKQSENLKKSQVIESGVNTASVDSEELVAEKENLISAKFDLIRAYIEIEDNESAKNLLQEMKDQGTEYQQKEAAQMLDALMKK